ncbi:DUF4326 domain-containing protein [Streptomyces sp. NPDC059680]|uniref:DUF4326 domain-containing protein n=1 Tax=Streptomyces sp. NPDC059680 TaxID=3346904 RepID=UPI0036A276EA
MYVGRHMTMGGWNFEAHPLASPYTLKDCGTPEASVAAYIRHLLDRPELLNQAGLPCGKVLAYRCTPASCHAHAIAVYVDTRSRDRLTLYAADLEWAADRVEQTLFNRFAAEGALWPRRLPVSSRPSPPVSPACAPRRNARPRARAVRRGTRPGPHHTARRTAASSGRTSRLP